MVICRFFTAGALKGRRFGSDEDVCVAVVQWFHQQPRGFCGESVGCYFNGICFFAGFISAALVLKALSAE